MHLTVFLVKNSPMRHREACIAGVLSAMRRQLLPEHDGTIAPPPSDFPGMAR